MYQKGNTFGRKKGTPNKRNTQKTLLKNALAKFKCNPFEAMIRIGIQAEEDGDLKTALSAFKEVAAYIAPKMRAATIKIEHVEIPNVVGAKPLTNDEWNKLYGRTIEGELVSKNNGD